jgi:hypothetical protein
VLVFHAVAFGPAAQSQLRTSGTPKFVAETAGFQVGPERFAVAGVADLAPVSMDGVSGDGAAPELSHAALAQALERHLKENPQDRGQLQVVAAFQAGETQ